MLTLEELHIRAALFRSIRSFFFHHGFVEVDTPVRQPVIIPEGNIQPLLSGDFFLQTSPELCMKRLIAAGCTKIFQICPCFRGEERGRRHLQEFMMLEWYRCDADYFHLMEDCQNLVRFVLNELHLQFPKSAILCTEGLFGNRCGTIAATWQRLTVAEAFERWSPLTVEKALAEDRFDEILVEYIEPQLGYERPAFLYDYPVNLAALAKKKVDDPSLAERFELYINGIELANGFSELTDPVEQRYRFEIELEQINSDSSCAMQMPEKFLNDLVRLGETAGIALGIDRLFMVMLGKKEINDAVPFSPLDL